MAPPFVQTKAMMSKKKLCNFAKIHWWWYYQQLLLSPQAFDYGSFLIIIIVIWSEWHGLSFLQCQKIWRYTL